MRFAIGTATASSATQIPNNAIVQDCWINVTTPYSPGASIEVGVSGSLSAFMTTGETTGLIQSTGVISVSPQDVAVTPAAVVTATVIGGPGAGAATVTVRYCQTPNT